MLHRRLQCATRLLIDGQGTTLVAGFGRQQCAPAAAAAAAVHFAPLAPPLAPGLRWHSQLAEREQDKPQEGVVYVGPFGSAVKRVKNLSLFSCACAVAAGPIILGLDTSGATLMAKGSIVATLASFGVFTTGLLSWFTSPYVLRLSHDPATDTMEATTLTLLARPRTEKFNVAEVAEAVSVHPLSSFAARGRIYYVDAEHFPNKALLARLLPQQAAASAMNAANAAQQQQQQQQQAAQQAQAQQQQRQQRQQQVKQ